VTLLFDIRVLWHSLTFAVRFLNSTFAFCIPSESLRSLRHSFQRVKSRGSAIAVPEFASWIPRRLPQLFPRTLLIAVEKLYNRREKRSKYKFSETGKLVFVRCVGLSVLHIFWSSFIVSDGRSVVDSVDCCLLFKLSTQLEIEVLQLLHSIRFALSLIYPVATWLLHAGCAIYLDIGCCIFSDAVVDINMIDLYSSPTRYPVVL
jgi:hypothetical protein